jgi:branched-chain amino acid transport system ATP-binding protein
MLLEVKEIEVFYGKVQAVRKVSLQVPEKDIVTLLGANGAGKTTVLKTISGLKQPASGEIYFNGNRIDRLPAWDIVRMGIGYVPEGRHLFPNMTVEDNLSLGAYTRHDRQSITAELEKVYQRFPRLKERKKQKAYSMSGGEQQMLAIGRALMCQPKLLLLDEPSLGLSPVMVDEISSIISTIHREGMCILLVEQNAAIALKLANQGYVMETGQITFNGSSAELLKDDRVKKAYLGG